MRPVLLTAIFVFSAAAFAQEPENISTVFPTPRQIEESLLAGSAISGARIVGIMRAGEDRWRNKPEFRVRIPADWQSDTVCLRLVSSDALYTASANYDVAQDKAAKTVRLEFESAKQQFWDSLAANPSSDSVAALVTLGACDTLGELRPAIPVEIAAPAGQATVTVYLNTFRADAAFVVWGDEELDCEPVQAPVRTAFDMKCTLDLDTMDPASNGSFLIYPERAGELGQAIEARLLP